MGKNYNAGDAQHGSRDSGCRVCGSSLADLPSRRRYCDDCDRYKHADIPSKVGQCRMCGAVMVGVHPNRRFCGQCKAQRRADCLVALQVREPERARTTQDGKNFRKRLRRFALTPEQYEAVLSAQAGRCAVCLGTQPNGRGTWHIDHCHVTGVVRGLLCHHCNVGLGNFRDDPANLLRAREYLLRYQPAHPGALEDLSVA